MSYTLAFCSNKDFFKSPFIQPWLRKSGVCCCHGDSMAATPETTFLSTFLTMESVLTAVHTEHLLTKCLSQFPIVNTMEHCNGPRGKLSAVPLYHTLYGYCSKSKSESRVISFTLWYIQHGPTQCQLMSWSFSKCLQPSKTTAVESRLKLLTRKDG